MHPVVLLYSVFAFGGGVFGGVFGGSSEPTMLHTVYNLYKECGGLSVLEECLSKKVALDLDRLQRIDIIPLNDLMSLKRSEHRDDEPPLTEEELEKSTARGLGDPQERLDTLIMEKIAGIVAGRNLQFQWKPSLEEVEGRTMRLRSKLIFPFIMGVVLKMVAFFPVVLATLTMMAFKAVIASKIALVLASFIGFKKLIHHDKHHEESNLSLDFLKLMTQHGDGHGSGVGSGDHYGGSDYLKRVSGR